MCFRVKEHTLDTKLLIGKKNYRERVESLFKKNHDFNLRKIEDSAEA